MFMECPRLKSLKGLEEWNTENAVKISNMFEKCESLRDISALSHWNVSNVLSFYSMFAFCESLYDIKPLSSWNVSNGRIFEKVFYYTPMRSAQAINHWNVSKGLLFLFMFNNYKKIFSKIGWKLSKAIIDESYPPELYKNVRNTVNEMAKNVYVNKNKMIFEGTFKDDFERIAEGNADDARIKIVEDFIKANELDEYEYEH